MDIRRFFYAFIEESDFTDEELMQLYQEEQERAEMRKEITLRKQSLLLTERSISST